MEFLPFLWISILLIILFIIWSIQYIIAKKFEKVAFDKGYDSEIHAFAMCFFLGIVGCIYVAALPDLNLHTETLKKDFLENEFMGNENDKIKN